MELKEEKIKEFIIVKVESENENETEYLRRIRAIDRGEHYKFVREYNKSVFTVGGKVCLENDDRLWIIKEIVYNEELDVNIIYIINKK